MSAAPAVPPWTVQPCGHFWREEKRTDDVTEEDVRRMANIFGARSVTNKHIFVQQAFCMI